VRPSTEARSIITTMYHFQRGIALFETAAVETIGCGVSLACGTKRTKDLIESTVLRTKNGELKEISVKLSRVCYGYAFEMIRRLATTTFVAAALLLFFRSNASDFQGATHLVPQEQVAQHQTRRPSTDDSHLSAHFFHLVDVIRSALQLFVQHHVMLNPHGRAAGLQEFLRLPASLASLVSIAIERRHAVE